MDVTFGIDPGYNSGGYTVCVEKTKNMVAYPLDSISSLLEHLHEYKDLRRRIVLEDVPPYVGKDIPSSTSFKLGQSCGLIEGLALGLYIPCEKITPKRWQKGLSDLKGKTGSPRKRVLRDHATRLYPHLKPTLRTADALLLTHFYLTHNIESEES